MIPTRRTTQGLAAAVAASLALAAFAVADAGPATTTAVSATFFANALVSTQSSSCTGTGGDTFQVTHERFTGTAASSDARLAGPVTVDVTSALDTTKNLGWLHGDLRIDTTTAGAFHAHLAGVSTNGAVQGFVAGGGAGARLLGSFSGTFSPSGGFGSQTAPVAIGSGTATNTALLTSGGCAPGPAPHPHPLPPPHPKPMHVQVTVKVHHPHVQHSQKHDHNHHD